MTSVQYIVALCLSMRESVSHAANRTIAEVRILDEVTPSVWKSIVLVPTLHKNDPTVEAKSMTPLDLHFDSIGRSSVNNGIVCEANITGMKNNNNATTNNVPT